MVSTMVNMRLKLEDSLHRRLKTRAAMSGKTLQETAEAAITQYVNILDFEPICIAPEQAMQDAKEMGGSK